MADVALQMRVEHSWCLLADVFKPWLKSPNRCAHKKIDAWNHLLMLHHVGQSHLLDAHIPCPCMESLVKSCIPLNDFAFEIRIVYVCTCSTWQKSHEICRRLFPDAHKSCLMHTSLGCVTTHLPTSADWCVRATYDVGRPHPTSAELYVKATNNIGRPHSMSVDKWVHAMY